MTSNYLWVEPQYLRPVLTALVMAVIIRSGYTADVSIQSGWEKNQVS